MARFLIRRLWQMVPTLAGVMVLIFVLFNWVGGDPRRTAGRPDRRSRARAGDPRVAGGRPALVDATGTVCPPGADLRFRSQLGDQRGGAQHLSDPPGAHAHHHAAGAGARDRAGRAARAGGGPGARHAHRPPHHDPVHSGDVDFVPGLHHRLSIPVRIPAGLVSGAGLERRSGEESARLCPIAGPVRGGGIAGAADPVSTESFWLEQLEQDYVRRACAPRACVRPPSCCAFLVAAHRCADPDPDARGDPPAGGVRRFVPARKVLLDPGPGPRGDHRGRAQ